MSKQITATYKDEIITWSDYNGGIWRWGEYTNASIEKVADCIDRAMKADYKPTEAYYFNYFDREKPIKVTATSKAEDRHWWAKKGGKRTKIGPLFAITPENDEILEKIAAQNEAVKSQQEILDALHRSLTELTVQHMRK